MTAKPIFMRPVLLLALLLVTLASTPVYADSLQVKQGAPETYTVVRGDTLWGISGRYLDQPWRWPELWKGNPQIENPHLIYPGDVLSLYYENGQPRLGINRGKRHVKLSPRIRASQIDTAIPVVPIEAIQQFLHHLTILDKSETEKMPYILRGSEGRIAAAQGDRIYVMNIEGGQMQENFQLYRIGDPINDPDTGETIAHEGIFVGDAKMEQMGSPATLLMTSSQIEAKVGDRLFPAETDSELTNFYPKLPAGFVEGRILTILDGANYIGRFQAVIINLGKSNGLQRGDVLSSYSRPETVADTVTEDPHDTVVLPPERTGTLMIIKPFENLSYALVMESRLPLKLHDKVRTPQ